MDTSDLTKDQKNALDTLVDWFNTPSKGSYIVIGGLAGTGKTTIISMFRKLIGMKTVAFVAYTGKAASVMRNKLLSASVVIGTGIYANDTCGTIHSLMYTPVEDESGYVIDWHKIPRLDGIDLIVVDECSMVSKAIFDDIMSYGIPTVFVGDHGQLPPIESDGFNLMDKPDAVLETIHRFAQNSELLKVSMMARKDGVIPYGEYGDQVIKCHTKDPRIKEFLKSCGNFSDSIVLCGFNNSRVKMNKKIRKSMLGRIDDDPMCDDRIICLKNNKNAFGGPIYNGMTATITSLRSFKNCYDISASIDGENRSYKGAIWQNSFMKQKIDTHERPYIYKKDLMMYRKMKSIGDYYSINNYVKENNRKIYLDIFDFAYAITVHKSQGSEYNNVFLIEEGRTKWTGDIWNKWLYTAVTRAKKKLMIVS